MRKKVIIQPRKCIKNFAPYVPGRDITEIKKEYGLETVIKLASNESLWGPSPKVKKAIKNEINNLHIYPPTDPLDLKKEISKTVKKGCNEIVLGNGTDEIIELIAKTFLTPENNIVTSDNSFIRYKMAGKLMDCKIVEVPQSNYKINLSRVFKAVTSKTKIVYIDNPCNPTGTGIEKKEIADFFKSIKEIKNPPLIVFDEAYIEYTDKKYYCSALAHMNKDIPIAVLRTFSKIYGLAGLRIGYGLASPEIVSLINRIRPPFNTNRMAQSAALEAIKDAGYINKVAEATLREKLYIYRELERLGLNYVPSQTNFILIEFGARNISSICKELLRKGIIIRPLSGYSLRDFIRVTVGKRSQNKIFISAIEKMGIKSRRN